MKIPNIKKFKTTKDYFEAIYELNKKEKPIFSYRFFAKKLDWPVSYLNDVIKGRKKTTMARAIQFSKKFDLSTFQSEYLIFLCLAESENDNISEYFKDKIDKTTLKKEKNTAIETIAEIYTRIDYVIFYELIGWGQGQIPVSKLVLAQNSYPEFHDKLFQKEAINFLLKEKLIKKLDKEIYIQNNVSEITIDDQRFSETAEGLTRIANSNIKSLENLIRFYKQYTGRGLFFNSFLMLRKERFPEIMERFNSFRDWMITLTNEERTENLNEYECMKIEMHFTPVFSASGKDVLEKST